MYLLFDLTKYFSSMGNDISLSILPPPVNLKDCFINGNIYIDIEHTRTDVDNKMYISVDCKLSCEVVVNIIQTLEK